MDVAYVETVPCPATAQVARLRMLVADAVLPPGDASSITQIAVWLDTDPAAALEVLMELGRDGYLERLDAGHIRVATVEEFPGSDVLGVRILLEPAALRSAGEHVRPADMITLRHQERRITEAVSEQDFPGFRRAEDALVASLLSLHPNAELARLIADLRLRTPYDGLRAAVECGFLADRLQPHRRLLDLIEAGDGAAVADVVADALQALRFVGTPVMDAPHLNGVPLGREGQPDGEFLDAPSD